MMITIAGTGVIKPKQWNNKPTWILSEDYNAIKPHAFHSFTFEKIVPSSVTNKHNRYKKSRRNLFL